MPLSPPLMAPTAAALAPGVTARRRRHRAAGPMAWSTRRRRPGSPGRAGQSPSRHRVGCPAAGLQLVQKPSFLPLIINANSRCIFFQKFHSSYWFCPQESMLHRWSDLTVVVLNLFRMNRDRSLILTSKHNIKTLNNETLHDLVNIFSFLCCSERI